MAELFSSFHFLRPWWFAALIPCAALLYYLYQQGDLKLGAWQKICDPKLLATLKVKSYKSSHLLILCASIWGVMIFALAGPTWSKKELPAMPVNDSWVIALKVDKSMLAEDLKPSRLDFAKFKIQDFLKLKKDGNFALVAFTNEAFVVVPLTEEKAAIYNMLNALTPDIMPVAGTNFKDALAVSSEVLKHDHKNFANILLVTDGSATAEDIKFAHSLQQAGTKVSVLAIGQEERALVANRSGIVKDKNGNLSYAALDLKSLQELALQGGGVFTQAGSLDHDLNLIVQTTQHDHNAYSQELSKYLKQWIDQGYKLCFLLLPLLALVARRGWL